jgi:hypothetical protein
MSVVIDISLTPLQFMKDGKIYNLTEVIKDGETRLLITADEVAPADSELIKEI